MRTLTAGLIGIWAMAIPVAAGASEEPLPTVQLQMEVGDDIYTEPSGLTIRTAPGEPVVLRVEVFAEGDPSSPIAVENTGMLLKVQEASGVGMEVRFADMEEIGAGTYETSYTFPQSREYVIVVLPDVEDRSLLTPETTDEVTVAVGVDTEPVPTGPAWPMVIAGMALFLAVGLLVYQATRGRRRVPKRPVHHDTWWNSP